MTDSDTEQKRQKKKYQQTERVNDRNKKRIRVREKMKILEERKTEKQKIIRNMYIEEIQNKIKKK